MSSSAITELPANRELIARVRQPGLGYVMRFLFLLARTRLALTRRSPIGKRGAPMEAVRSLLPDAEHVDCIEASSLELDRYEAEKARDIHAFGVWRTGRRPIEVVLKYGKRLAPALQAFMHAANMGCHREVLFHQRLAAHLPVRTARLLGARSCALTGDYQLLLERVHGAARPDHGGLSTDEAGDALDALAALHSVPLASLPSLDWIVGNSNDRPFRWLILFFKQRFDERFQRVFAALCDYLNTLNPCLVHVDYRPGNLLFHDEGTDGRRVTILDWVGVSISAGVFDVVYFMTLGLPAEQRRAEYATLTERYLQALARRGCPCAREAFDRDYQVLSLLFAMACHGYGEVELFVDWNVDDAQWDDWKHKLRAVVEELDYARIAEATGCPVDDLRQAAAALAL